MKNRNENKVLPKKFKNMFEKLKTFLKITKIGAIARRYFVNNFYDGLLTVLGILLGFFILIFRGDTNFVESTIVLLTGFATSISMLISGISGSYLSEKAEQRKVKLELDKAMVIIEEDRADDYEITKEDLEKAMLKDVKFDGNLQENQKSGEEVKKKTIQEKAETVAAIIASLVNGLAPFLGGIIPLIPFFLVDQACLETFIISFIIIFSSIIFLGIFLGLVSRESIIKNILQMLIAFLLTITISIIFLSIS